MAQVKVIHDECTGHARCAAKAPEVYHLDAEGFNRVGTFRVPAEAEQKARLGARWCPERAIIVIADE
jgi:ferredoxin